MSDVMDKKKIEEAMKAAMPSLKEGKVPEDAKNKANTESPILKQAIEQAGAKEAVKKYGDVEPNVGQPRNIGEGPMILRTEQPKDQGVDAVTGAAPMTPMIKGGVKTNTQGAIPQVSGPQIIQDGPPPDYADLETPDMRATETKGDYKKTLEALEKEDEPTFWDMLQGFAAGYAGRESNINKRKQAKLEEKSKSRLMEKEAAINKASQLELLAKQAEIEGNRDKALALQREADAQRNQARAVELLEKEYGLKKGDTGNFVDLIGKFLGGQK